MYMEVVVNVQSRFDAVSINSDVMSSALPDGGSVLLHLETELYFGLNEVGSLLWDSLSAGEPYETAVSNIERRFGVDRERIDADVSALLDQLGAKGLLTHDA
jgi:hypothetical protein